MALLEARLTEEKEWRKQLELDLSAAQTALKKDKEVITKHINVYIQKWGSNGAYILMHAQ